MTAKNVRKVNQHDRVADYNPRQQDNPDVAALLRRIYDRSLAVGAEWIRVGQKYKAIPEEVDADAASRQLLAWTYGQLVQRTIAPDAPAPNQVDIQRLFAQLLRVGL